MDFFGVLLVLTFGLRLSAATGEAFSTIHDRIFNGTEIDITEVPHMVGIEYGNDFLCGGSIISKTHVLTAAHCVMMNLEMSITQCRNLIIRTGTNLKRKGGKVIPVESIFVHPKYSAHSKNLDYDVALLQLKSQIEFDHKSKAILLSQREPSTTDEIQLTGWGRTVLYGIGTCGSKALKAITMPVINSKTCEEALNPKFDDVDDCEMPNFSITPRMFCAHGKNRSGYIGDSGSPITHNRTLVGIESGGWGINPKNFGVELLPGSYPDNIYLPNVFTKISDPEIMGFIRGYVPN